jgi:hypothetical protein
MDDYGGRDLFYLRKAINPMLLLRSNDVFK